MAALAVNGVDGLAASDVELRRAGPSYTADTLSRLTASGLSPSQIFFITGADAFAEIATGSAIPTVLDLAHFVVVSRPGLPSATAVRASAGAGATDDSVGPGGAANRDRARPAIFLVDAATPDVSSTEIRGRLRPASRSAGLVPPPSSSTSCNTVCTLDAVGPLTADHLHGEN